MCLIVFVLHSDGHYSSHDTKVLVVITLTMTSLFQDKDTFLPVSYNNIPR